MGEFVEQSIEELVPVFEQLQRVELFDENEVRFVIKKCRSFEYRLQKIEKRSDDFLNYIDYLCNFYALIRKRRESLDYWFKKVEIDGAISRKTEALYRRLCNRFQYNLNFWLQRIEFNKKRKADQTVSAVYTKLLQVHGDKEELWIAAATWEFEDRGSVENGRNILQNALNAHSKSLQLWTEMFRFEYVFVAKILERRKFLTEHENDQNQPNNQLDGAPDAVLELKLVKLVLEEALDKCDNKLDVYINFWRVSKLFSFPLSIELTAQLVQTIIEDFADVEISWIFRAEQCFVSDLLIDSVAIREQAEVKAFEILIEGSQRINTKKMWRLVLEFVKNRLNLEEKSDRLKQLLCVHCNRVLSSMHDRQFTEQNDYSFWMTICEENKKMEILQLALDLYPQSADFWYTLVELKILDPNSSSKDINKLFNKAIKKVAEVSTLPLWKLGVQWSKYNNPDQLAVLFENSFLFPSCVSNQMKQLYLQWITSDRNSHVIRSEFKRLSQMKPNSLDIYMNFIKSQQLRPEIDLSSIRSAFEQAITEFGTETSDLWLEYLKFEVGAQPGNVPILYQRAMQHLKLEKSEDFVVKWSLFNSEK